MSWFGSWFGGTEASAEVAAPPIVEDAVVGDGSIDHVAAALTRVCEQFKKSPNYLAFLTSLVTPIQSVENAMRQLLLERDIYTAIGDQLDTLGKIVGQPRNGLSDTQYRRYLLARIGTSKSNGIVEDLLAISVLVVNDTDVLHTIETQGIAALVLSLTGDVVTDDVAEDLIVFLRDAVSAGVRIIIEYYTFAEASSFTFAAAAFLSGAQLTGVGFLTVNFNADYQLFPSTGSIIIDEGTSQEEVKSYVTRSQTVFTLSGTTAKDHADDATVTLYTGPGLGWGDSTDAGVGGNFATALE